MERGAASVVGERLGMKIGVSYDQGTSKYRLYVDALFASAQSAGSDVDAVWLSGADRAVDTAALEQIDGLLLTGGADVEPQRYGREDARPLCATRPGRDDAELAILARAF